jgi:ABC-type amino acid transport substrate-binding protein
MRFMQASIVALLLLAAGASAQAGVLDRLKAGEAFKIGFREDAAPYAYRDDKGQPAGYSVALCNAVADDLKSKLGLPKLEVKFVPVTADSRFVSVQNGSIDIECGASTVTLSRRETVDFSIATFIDGASVLFRKDGPTAFEQLGGHRVAVRSGTTTETVMKTAMAKIAGTPQIVSVSSHQEGLRRLEQGDVTAYFADQSILMFLLFQSDAPDKLQLSDRFFTREPYGLVLPHGDEDFRLFVDRTLSRLYRNGDIGKIFAKSFGPKAKPSNLLQSLYVINALPE